MQLLGAVWVLVALGALCAAPASAQDLSGAQGSEGEPNRRQQWLVRSPDPATAAHGGGGDFHVLAASGSEGHRLVQTDSGMKTAGPELDRALKALSPTSAKKR
jgi:hypothetical protein